MYGAGCLRCGLGGGEIGLDIQRLGQAFQFASIYLSNPSLSSQEIDHEVVLEVLIDIVEVGEVPE